MTGRRSLQTFTERMSRQTQFVPGHAGGRVASAQPVRRRESVGSVSQTEPSQVVLRATTWADGEYADVSPTPVGGGGAGTLGDNSDSTYLSCPWAYYPDTPAQPSIAALIESWDATGKTISAVTCTVRARILSSTASTITSSDKIFIYVERDDLAAGIQDDPGIASYGSGEAPIGPGTDFPVGGSWTDFTFTVPTIPDSADFTSGRIFLDIGGSYPNDLTTTYEFADAWLTVTYN